MLIYYREGYDLSADIIAPPPALILWEMIELLNYIKTYPTHSEGWICRVLSNLRTIGSQSSGIDRDGLADTEIERLFNQGELRAWLVTEASNHIDTKKEVDPDLLIPSSGDELADLTARMACIFKESDLSLSILERYSVGSINAIIKQWIEYQRDPKERKMEKVSEDFEKELGQGSQWLAKLDDSWITGN